MSFSSENGYIPESIESIMDRVRENVNLQFGTTYDDVSFVGTNFYKYFYSLIQELQSSEVKTSEIFAKLQQYFVVTNERLFRPSTTPEGIIDRIAELGYEASVKKMIDGDAGKIHVCVDIDDGIDDYAAEQLAINTVLKNCVVAGVVPQGTETDAIVLSNGQSFDFKYYLPDRHEMHLRLTITLSENNQISVLGPDDIKELLMANIAARYRLGLNFEPQKYFGTEDAPWASVILLEYAIDSPAFVTWQSAVIDVLFDDLYEIALENVTLIEN